MAIDLVSMSRKDLLKLQKDVEKALKAVEQKDRSDALKAAERAVAEYGFTLDEVNAAPRGAKSGKGVKALPKYRNPAAPEQTWTGRGRKPGWIHDALAKGLDITDLEI
jgi:DNA-binding protein H-NS